MAAPEIVQYPTLKMKRGDTFLFPFYVWEDKEANKKLPLTNITFRSQLRKSGELIAELTISVHDAANSLVVLSYPESTETWPTGKLFGDIEIRNTTTEQKISSETFVVEVGKDETHD